MFTQEKKLMTYHTNSDYHFLSREINNSAVIYHFYEHCSCFQCIPTAGIPVDHKTTCSPIKFYHRLIEGLYE